MQDVLSPGTAVQLRLLRHPPHEGQGHDDALRMQVPGGCREGSRRVATGFDTEGRVAEGYDTEAEHVGSVSDSQAWLGDSRRIGADDNVAPARKETARTA